MARVQASGSQNAAAGTTINQTLAGNVSTGDTIVVGIGGGAIQGVGDSLGNVYTLAKACTDQTLFIYAAPILTAGALTVSASFTGSTSFRSIVAAEYTSIASSNVIDASTQTTSGSAPGGTITSSAIATTKNGDTLVSFATDGTRTITWGAGSGYTLAATSSGTTGFTALEDQVQSAANAATTSSFTGFTTNDGYDLILVAFSPPPAFAPFLVYGHTGLDRIANIEAWLNANMTGWLSADQRGLNRLSNIEDFLTSNNVNSVTFLPYGKTGTDRLWNIESYLLAATSSNG